MDIDPKLLDEITNAAVAADLTAPERRRLLLACLPSGLTQNLPVLPRPRDQLISDVIELARQPTASGDSLAVYLDNCARLAKSTAHEVTFRDLRARRAMALTPTQDTTLDARFHLGEQLPNSTFPTWRAYDDACEAQVRVYVLPQEHRADHSLRHAFTRAMRRTRDLTHPHITHVIHVTSPTSQPLYFVTEWLTRTLDAAVRATDGIGRLDALARIAEVADALDYAHRQGEVHRAVSPRSIHIGADGRARLEPFGLPRLEETGRVDRDQAPELRNGRHAIGPAADVYGLGRAILFALNGGDPPGWFDRRPDDLLCTLACTDRLRALLRRCNASDPATRPTAGELHRVLATIGPDDLTRAATPKAQVDDWALGLLLDTPARLVLVPNRRLLVHQGRHLTLTSLAWDELMDAITDRTRPLGATLDAALTTAGLHPLRAQLCGQALDPLSDNEIRVID